MKKTIPVFRAAKITAMVLLALGLLLPPSARAEIRKGSIEVEAYAGYNMFSQGQNLSDCLIWGGRLGYNLSRRFGIEAAVGLLGSQVDDIALTEVAKGRFISPMDKVDLTFYQIDLLFHFMPEKRFNPFIAAGFGQIHYSPKVSDTDMATFDFGVGAKYWLAKHLALRVDLKDNLVGEVFKDSFHNINMTAGLVLSFGGKDKDKPAAKSRTKPVEKVVIAVAEEPEEKIEERAKAIVADPKIEEKVVVLAFEDILFELDNSSLRDSAKSKLKRSVQILKGNPKARIRIAGYTSASGTPEYNMDLSKRRATAVRDYLVKEGVVSPDRLTIIGYGETRPAVHESAPTDLYSKAAKANMRVLFEVLVK